MIIMTKCIPHHLHKRAVAYSDNIYVYTMETDLSAHLRDVALVLADLEKNGITAEPSKIVLRNAETASYKKDRQLHSLNRPGRLEERNK